MTSIHTELYSLVTHTNSKRNMPFYYKVSLAGRLSSSHTGCFPNWKSRVRISVKTEKFLKLANSKVHKLLHVALMWMFCVLNYVPKKVQVHHLLSRIHICAQTRNECGTNVKTHMKHIMWMCRRTAFTFIRSCGVYSANAIRLESVLQRKIRSQSYWCGRTFIRAVN